jgi:hypothetical protein
MLASGTQDRGFAPDRSRRILSVEKKIISMPSFGGEVKHLPQVWGLQKNLVLSWITNLLAKFLR